MHNHEALHRYLATRQSKAFSNTHGSMPGEILPLAKALLRTLMPNLCGLDLWMQSFSLPFQANVSDAPNKLIPNSDRNRDASTR